MEASEHVTAMKHAIEEAYREGARSRDAEVERLKDALECVRDTKIRSCLALTAGAETCRDCFSSRLNWCPACIASAALEVYPSGNSPKKPDSSDLESFRAALQEIREIRCDNAVVCSVDPTTRFETWITCRSRYPRPRDKWCRTCIAADALDTANRAIADAAAKKARGEA